MDSITQLPNELIIVIMKFCDSPAIVKFSETCIRFNELIYGTPELVEKILLTIPFAKPNPNYDNTVRTGRLCVRYGNSDNENEIQAEHIHMNGDELEAVHYSLVNSDRRYSRLRMTAIYEVISSNRKGVFFSLLRHLGETVTEFECRGLGCVSKEKFIEILFPMQSIRKLILADFSLKRKNPFQERNNQFIPNPTNFNFMLELNELNVVSFHLISDLFSRCRNLNRLEIDDCYYSNQTNDFIVQQTHLKHLTIQYKDNERHQSREDWIIIPELPFKLKSLSVYNLSHSDQFNQLLSNQSELEVLEFRLTNGQYFVLQINLQAVWSLPKLKELTIDLGPVCNISRAALLPHDLSNNTIELLNFNGTELFLVPVANSLRNARRINVRVIERFFNMSRLQLDVIDKITFSGDSYMYCPIDVPQVGRERFEEIFLNFTRRHTKIEKICIGHSEWLQHRDEFELSFEFCRSLVTISSNVKNLQLYNVPQAHVNELREYCKEIDSSAYLLIN